MTIALLGTGTMGFAMARVLLGAGFDVTVWNRSTDKARPLAEDGAVVAPTVAEAVSGADIVLTMLFDVDGVLDVMAQAQPSLQPDVLWLQCSTVGLDGTDRVAAFASEHGLQVLDAPMVGTKQPAEQGTLVVLASGDPGLRGRAQPVFDAVGGRTVWAGDQLGRASALKLACNAWVATLTAAVGQSLALAEGLGVDPQLFLDAIEGGASDSTYAHVKGAAMLKGEYPASFALDGVLKDVGLMLDASGAARMNPDLLRIVHQTYATASEDGHGREDVAAVYEALHAQGGERP